MIRKLIADIIERIYMGINPSYIARNSISNTIVENDDVKYMIDGGEVDVYRYWVHKSEEFWKRRSQQDG